MSTLTVNADSVLAIEIGSINTRAVLFDVVENRYRFLGAGNALTTAGAPFHDIMAGVREAISQLEQATGRTLIGVDDRLILPVQADGSGVDRCVATMSAGAPMRVVAVGLLEDVSAQSAQNLANTTYAQVVEVLSLNDRRSTAARLDAVLRARPDVIIMAGGAEGGASRSVMKLVEAVGLACYVTPKEQRPPVLFAGNQSLAKPIRDELAAYASVYIAPNIRPAIETEQLLAAQTQLAEVYRQNRKRHIAGVDVIESWTNGHLLSSAMTFGRTIRFIGNEYAKTRKGVLGVDVGGSNTTLAAAFGDNLKLHVNARLGIGENLPGLLAHSAVDEIIRWSHMELSEETVRDFIYNKAAYPASLPVTNEELALEHLLTSQIIQVALKKIMRSFPSEAFRAGAGLLPWFEPIIASGSVLTQAPSRGQTAMTLLNALQPTGVTTLALDQNNLAPMIGAASSVAPILTVQALDATNFINLGTVISPIGQAQPGVPILRVRVMFNDGSETTHDIKYGALDIINLPAGQSATLHLHPLHRFDVGMGGAGRSGSVKVIGGMLGLIIDARGRPINLPADPGRRRDLIKKWHWTLGAA